MVNACVAKKLDIPIWVDKDGVECTEEKSFGRKVTHKLVHPELCFVGDKVGGNTNMVGNGHKGGENL